MAEQGTGLGSGQQTDGVLEHAVLEVGEAEAQNFESAFARARHMLEATPGFRWLRLERCIESPGRYLLLVGWDRLEDHTEGFRGSERYGRWSELLHGFYDPFPTVEHYRPVLRSRAPGADSGN